MKKTTLMTIADLCLSLIWVCVGMLIWFVDKTIFEWRFFSTSLVVVIIIYIVILGAYYRNTQKILNGWKESIKLTENILKNKREGGTNEKNTKETRK